MNNTIENQNNIYIQGDSLSFNIQKQTGVFVSPGEPVILQSTANSVSSYEYTTGNKPFVLDNAVLIESRTETTTTGNYIERSYIIPTAGSNFQSSLFSGTTPTFTSGDLNAVKVLALCLATSSSATTSITVQINFRGSEEKKVVLTGVIENTLTNIPLENKINLDWEWFDI